MPHPQELHERAQRLHQLGFSAKAISRQFGVSHTTILRWINPESAERSRAAARAYKRRIRGVCQRCGGETRCCRKGTALPSRICGDCARQQQHENKYWNEERVVHAIQEWARRRGHPPSARDWVHGITDPDGYRFPAGSNVYRGKRNRLHPFATWAEAIEAAGFPRPVVGRKRGDRPLPPKRKPRSAAERREQAITALSYALAKENRDGNRDRKGNNHD